MAFRFHLDSLSPASLHSEQHTNNHCLESFIVPGDFAVEVPTEVEKIVVNNSRTLYKRKSSELTSQYFGVGQQCQDVIHGVYEGGFKLWEGAIDLVEFLDKRKFDGIERGLELGCGHGLPGILALQAGVKMDFQDLNEPVITQVLFPNIVLNDCISQASDSLFLAGDWSCLIHPQLKERYDCIFASEVVYRMETFPVLYDCLEYLLKDTGVAYISGKCFYFGVGGGTQAFHSFVNARKLSCVCVHRIQDGKSNIREILQVTK